MFYLRIFAAEENICYFVRKYNNVFHGKIQHGVDTVDSSENRDAALRN